MEKIRKFGRDLQNDVCRDLLKEETIRKDIQTVYGRTLSKEKAKELCGELINLYKTKTDVAMEELYETEKVHNMAVKLTMASQKRRTKPFKNSGKLSNEMTKEMSNPGKLIYAMTRPLMVQHKERLTKLRDQLRAKIESMIVSRWKKAEACILSEAIQR